MAKFSANSVHVEEFRMKKAILGIIILAMVAFLLDGCGRRRDTDVTSSADYNFSSFAGTLWKTKVKVAVADVKLYTGKRVTYLLPPQNYDPNDPKYNPTEDMQMIAILPLGTRVRIEQLMEDNGVGGLLFVTASLEDGKVVHLSHFLLAKNRFIFPGKSDSKNWGVDPDLLEKAE